MRKLKNKSITNRFILYLTVMIIASNCLIFSIQFFLTNRNMEKQSVEMGLNLMESNLTIIEQYFDDVDNIAYSLIYNRELIRTLKTDMDSAADVEWLNGLESLSYNSRPDLHMYFFKEGSYNSVYSILKSQNIEDYRYEAWYQEFLWTDEERVLLSSNADKENPEFVQSIVYRINDIYRDDVVGYLKIDMNLEALKKKFLHSYSRIAGMTILDERGNILFYDKLMIQPEERIFEDQKSGMYETDSYFISYGISENTGWRLCMAMSKDEIFQNQYALVPILLVMLFLVLLITFLAAGRLFSIITVNFRRLSEGMNEVKKGNLQVWVEADVQDEIAQLIREFNDMLVRLNELVKTVEAKQILLKEAEIKALQQQINPHFMHNIMETIMGLASEGMDQEVIEVSKCMSNMLRYNTRFENVTTLREEITQIQNYVKVLKIRFEDRFEVFYDIDEECMDCAMVKFTLQPLVENAVSHGLAETWRDGILKLSVKREEDKVSILIFDNGTGIPPEQLAEIEKRLEETTESPLKYIDQYKSLGVLNVHLRLCMYYGEDYSIEIFSKPGKGTCFSIKIPYMLRQKSAGKG